MLVSIRLFVRKWILLFSESRVRFASFCMVYFLLLAIFAAYGDRGLLKSYQLWQYHKNLTVEINELKERKQVLFEQISLFRDNKRQIEKYAREELNMVGENEVQFIFP